MPLEILKSMDEGRKSEVGKGGLRNMRRLALQGVERVSRSFRRSCLAFRVAHDALVGKRQRIDSSCMVCSADD